jgi:hypothetical protein
MDRKERKGCGRIDLTRYAVAWELPRTVFVFF